jgi:hypothetical protein
VIPILFGCFLALKCWACFAVLVPSFFFCKWYLELHVPYPIPAVVLMCSCASPCGKCFNALTEDTIMDKIDGLKCTTLLRFVQFSFHEHRNTTFVEFEICILCSIYGGLYYLWLYIYYTHETSTDFCCVDFEYHIFISHNCSLCSYFTNTLVLPIVNGPTEGLMLIYVCHIFTFFTGTIWLNLSTSTPIKIHVELVNLCSFLLANKPSYQAI